MSDTYVVHFCKNKNCNNAWLDLDLTNAQSRPPSWKYCSECCEKYGYVNPPTPPKRKNYEQRLKLIETFRGKFGNFQAKKINENERKLSA